MKPRVYLETTIPSYLTAWPSRDLLVAANQQVTRDWWARRDRFELLVSQIVVRECQAGDPTAAAARLDAIRDLPLLVTTDAAVDLADALTAALSLPPQVGADAFHIATAAVHAMDYLLTWNCTHIANAVYRGRIEKLCRGRGYEPPAICTPQELLSEDADGEG